MAQTWHISWVTMRSGRSSRSRSPSIQCTGLLFARACWIRESISRLPRWETWRRLWVTTGLERGFRRIIAGVRYANHLVAQAQGVEDLRGAGQ